MQYPLTAMAQEGLSLIISRLHPNRSEIAELQAAGVSQTRIAALYPLGPEFYQFATTSLMNSLKIERASALAYALAIAALDEKLRPLFHAPLMHAYSSSAQRYFGEDATELLRMRLHNLIAITHIIATYDHAARLDLLANEGATTAHRATISRWRSLHNESMRFWDALQALEVATSR